MPLTAIAQMPRRIHIPSLHSVVCYGLPPLTPPLFEHWKTVTTPHNFDMSSLSCTNFH
jgi:hypothetical protein